MLKFLTAAFLFFPVMGFAQSISTEEAQTLKKSLINSTPDTAKINALLKLAKYQVFKPGENKDDLDSAAAYIKNAENLNASIKSKWASGYALLIKSNLLRESGKNEEAKESARQAMIIL